MTDLPSSNHLDPKRPWIKDERDLPSEMSWTDTLFNPFGESSRVHFTRAQTVLFFVAIPFFVAGQFFGQFAAAFAGFFVLTFLSVVSHVRRLSDAGQPDAAGVFALTPLVAALAMFAVSLPASVEKANKVITTIEMDIADPEAAKERRAKEREEQRIAKEKAKAEGKDTKKKGRRGDRKEKLTAENYSSFKFIQKDLGSKVFGVWSLVALLTLIWTVFWVARLPNGGGTIDERMSTERERRGF